MPTVKSAEYAWKDMSVAMLGRELVRILEIEYTTETEKTPLYGRGNKTIGIGVGNEKVTGSLTIGQSELIALEQLVGTGGKVTDLVFDINIAYLQANVLAKDRVVQAQFTGVPKGWKQGDPSMEIKLPFVAVDIQTNI